MHFEIYWYEPFGFDLNVPVVLEIVAGEGVVPDGEPVRDPDGAGPRVVRVRVRGRGVGARHPLHRALLPLLLQVRCVPIPFKPNESECEKWFPFKNDITVMSFSVNTNLCLKTGMKHIFKWNPFRLRSVCKDLQGQGQDSVGFVVSIDIVSS